MRCSPCPKGLPYPCLRLHFPFIAGLFYFSLLFALRSGTITYVAHIQRSRNPTRPARFLATAKQYHLEMPPKECLRCPRKSSSFNSHASTADGHIKCRKEFNTTMLNDSDPQSELWYKIKSDVANFDATTRSQYDQLMATLHDACGTDEAQAKKQNLAEEMMVALQRGTGKELFDGVPFTKELLEKAVQAVVRETSAKKKSAVSSISNTARASEGTLTPKADASHDTALWPSSVAGSANSFATTAAIVSLPIRTSTNVLKDSSNKAMSENHKNSAAKDGNGKSGRS